MRDDESFLEFVRAWRVGKLWCTDEETVARWETKLRELDVPWNAKDGTAWVCASTTCASPSWVPFRLFKHRRSQRDLDVAWEESRRTQRPTCVVFRADEALHANEDACVVWPCGTIETHVSIRRRGNACVLSREFIG